MHIRIEGDGIASAYLACRLREGGVELSWLSGEWTADIRPLRLSAPRMNDLRALFSRHEGRIPEFLLNAREIDSWGGGQVALRSVVMAEQLEHWVDASLLREALLRMATHLGVAPQTRHPLAPPPKVQAGQITLLELDTERLGHWPDAYFVDVRRRARGQAYGLSYWLPQGELPADAPALHLELWRGNLLLLEPHPQAGFVLSLHAWSAEAIEGAARELDKNEDAPSEWPARWRALWLLNRGARAWRGARRVGAHALRLPGVFLLGSSLGSLPPAAHRDTDHALAQAERARESVMELWSGESSEIALLRASELHFVRERARLQAATQRALLSEKALRAALVSQGWSARTLGAAALLTPRLRRWLESPL